MPKIPQQAERRYEIYNESCFETFKRIPSGSVDMILCDPPYATTQNSWDSVIPLVRMWMELKRVIKRNRAIVLMANQPFVSLLITSQPNLYAYDWIWEKSNKTGALNVSRRPLRGHEHILVFGNNPRYFPQGLVKIHAPITKQPEKSRNTASYGKVDNLPYTPRFRNYPISIIKEATEGNHEHPTQKPVALMEYLIKTYTRENELVLDFAMGSGTTGVAAGNLNRRFVGCDNDTEFGYFAIAERRIREAYEKGKT